MSTHEICWGVVLTGYRENVQHKNSIKLLRDEITSLKEELMEVKHANRILSGQLKALGPGHRSANLTVSIQYPRAILFTKSARVAEFNDY